MRAFAFVLALLAVLPEEWAAGDDHETSGAIELSAGDPSQRKFDRYWLDKRIEEAAKGPYAEVVELQNEIQARSIASKPVDVPGHPPRADTAAWKAAQARLIAELQARYDELRKVQEESEKRIDDAAQTADAHQQTKAAEEVRRQEVQRRRERKRNPHSRESFGVRCCDGTISPTCVTVHRGCCSHHGGVC